MNQSTNSDNELNSDQQLISRYANILVKQGADYMIKKNNARTATKRNYYDNKLKQVRDKLVKLANVNDIVNRENQQNG